MVDQVKFLIVEKNGTDLEEAEEKSFVPEELPFSDPSVTATDTKAAVVEAKKAATDHIARTDNPHGVTKAQLNLGNVQNVDTTTTSNINEGSKLFFTTARVLATALAGFTSSNSVISATDTILAAFGKAQGQISDIVTNFAANVRSVVLTGVSFVSASDVVATDTILQAIGKIQAWKTAHSGQGGAVHAAVTQATNGFMIAADKLKLDNALGRIVFPTVTAATSASNTTYTAVGANYVWVQSRNTLIKSGMLVYYVTISNRNFQLRVVNVDTGAILATSALITTTGYYTLTFTLPTADCRIGIQVLKDASGGSSPSLEGAQIAFETI